MSPRRAVFLVVCLLAVGIALPSAGAPGIEQAVTPSAVQPPPDSGTPSASTPEQDAPPAAPPTPAPTTSTQSSAPGAPSAPLPEEAIRDYAVSSPQAREQSTRFGRFGMSQGFAPLEMSSPEAAALFRTIARTGATVVRLDLSWAQIQAKGPTSFDFANTLRVFDAATAAGLTVLPVTSGMPAWAGSVYPKDPGAYFRFLYEAGKTLVPRGITSIEVWNEANLTGMTAEQYTKNVLIPGASGFRAAAAELGAVVSIVSTGLAPAKSNGHDVSQLDFLTGIYASGGAAYFDVVGTHPYTWPDDPTVSTNWNWLLKTVELRSLMEAQGDGEKQLWATEFGYPTNTGARGVSEYVQAQYIRDGARIWASWPWAGTIIFYSMQDLTPLDSDPEHNFGLLRADGSPKPALEAVVGAIAGR